MLPDTSRVVLVVKKSNMVTFVFKLFCKNNFIMRDQPFTDRKPPPSVLASRILTGRLLRCAGALMRKCLRPCRTRMIASLRSISPWRTVIVHKLVSSGQSRLRRAFGGLTIFPILEVVAIHISPNEFSHPTALDFRSLDKLKCLDIRGQKNNFNAHAIPQTQAAQLTNFRLERTSFDFEALGLFVNLRVLHFSPFDAPPARPFGLMSKVLLEQLESLTFVATSWNLTLSIFQRLCLPKLLNLSIALHSSPEPDSDSDTQTIPEVQPLFEEELHSILASFRQVTQLGLVVKTKELTIGRPFFEGLGLLKGPVRLPKLRLFSYEGNLQLESVFCLQSILERCSCRSPPPTTPNSSGSGSYSPDVAALKFVKIKSNDLRPFFLPNNFSRGTEAYATIKEMVVQNVLWLIDDEDKALI